MKAHSSLCALGVLFVASCSGGQPGQRDGAVDLTTDDGPVETLPRDALSDASAEGDSSPDAAPALASPHELATRMSRFLWGLPAADLEVEAALGAAPSAEDVASVASTMLKDARARDGIRGLVRWLLRLDALETQPKQGVTLSPALRASLAEEAPRFASYVILDGDDSFETLFLAPYTFMDRTLAEHYGVTPAGEDFQRTAYPTTDRVGLLGGAGVLTRYASVTEPSWPARRFWMLSDILTCESYAIDAPAPGVVGTPTTSATSGRQQMIDITNSDRCMVCHFVINPLSFAFNAFDFLGRRQMTDVDRAVDTSSTVPAAGGQPAITSVDQPDMMKTLVARPSSRRCFARRVLAYAVNPAPPAGDQNHALAESGSAAFRSSLTLVKDGFEHNESLTNLFVAITRTPAFLAPAP